MTKQELLDSLKEMAGKNEPSQDPFWIENPTWLMDYFDHIIARIEAEGIQ